jgi:DnaK suppressor protein
MAASRKRTAVKSKASKRPQSAARPAKKRPASEPKASAPAKRRVAAKPAPVTKAAPAAKVTAPVKPLVKKPVPPARPAVASKAEAKPKSKPPAKRKAASPQEVRPIGMLPPEAVARATRTIQRPVTPVRPRASTMTPRTAASNEGVQRVSEKDFKEFEERLLQERKRILKEMGHLETNVLKVNQRDSSGDLSGYSFHMADAGTDAMEREKAFLFASAEGRVLLEINDALRRLYQGEYGVCESCSNPIARARLEVMPHARLCVSCKEKEERAQRGAM